MRKLSYVLLVVVGLIVIIPNFIDWSYLKPSLVETVKKNIGYNLDIKGSINFGPLPSPHLKAHNISVKNKPGGQSESLLELKTLFVSLNIIPLLRGQIAIDNVELIEPVIHLETLETEQKNWEMEDGKLREIPIPNQGPIIKENPISNSSDKSHISLRKITIQNGCLSIANLKTKTMREFTNINLEGGLDSLSGPFNLKGKFDLDGFTVKTNIQTGHLFQETSAEVKANIGFSQDGQNYGNLQINGNLQGKKFVGDVHSDALMFPFDLRLANKEINFRKGFILKAHVEADPESVKFSELKAGVEAIKLEGQLSYKLSHLAGQLILSEGPAVIKLTLQGQSNERNLWKGHVTVHSDKPQAFFKWADIDDKALSSQGIIDLSASLTVDNLKYIFNGLKFNIGQLDGTGDVTVELGGMRPYVKGELSVGKLNVNVFLPNHKAAENISKLSDISSQEIASETTKKESKSWSKEDWNWQFLKTFNADFKLGIKEFYYDEYHLNQISLTLKLKEGDLQVNSFLARGYGGTLGGDLSLLQGALLKVNFGVHKLDLSSVPKVQRSPLKKAIFTTNLRLNTKVTNAYEALHRLKGEMSIDISQGIIEAFDVKKFVNDINRVKEPGDVSAVVKTLGVKAPASFDSLKASFSVQDGKASTQDIQFISSDIMLTGKGTIDLAEWLMNLHAQIKIKELNRLPSLGVVIEGSLDSPSYKVDQSELAKILIQEIAGRMLDNASQGIMDKVGNVLKGIGGKTEKENPQLKSGDSNQQQQKEPMKPEKVVKDLLKLF